MKHASRILVAIVLSCGAARQCAADVVLFNDYAPAFTYVTGTGWTASGATSGPGSIEAAGEFSPATTGAVSSVAFGVGLATGTNSVTMEIAADNGGTPGAVLESYSFVNQMGTFGFQNPPLTATSTLHPVLTAGTNYWVLALPGAPDTWAAWNYNDQSVTGHQMYSQDGGTTWTDLGTQTLGAFEILGTPSAVPEPSSLTLLGLGIAGVVGWTRRRRQSASSDQ